MLLLCRYLLNAHGIKVTTIEPDASQAVYGSLHHHIIAPLQHISQHVAHNTFDAIIINGVIGWGLNDHSTRRAAAKGVHAVLRAHGLVIIGYNYGTECCQEYDHLFSSTSLSQLPSMIDLHNSEMHHIFKLYRSNAAASSS